jgi:hypothetical protein
MFRVKTKIFDTLKLQRKHFVRYLSTPTLPEFADVVIIGEYGQTSGEKRRKEDEKLRETVIGKSCLKRNFL